MKIQQRIKSCLKCWQGLYVCLFIWIYLPMLIKITIHVVVTCLCLFILSQHCVYGIGITSLLMLAFLTSLLAFLNGPEIIVVSTAATVNKLFTCRSFSVVIESRKTCFTVTGIWFQSTFVFAHFSTGHIISKIIFISTRARINKRLTISNDFVEVISENRIRIILNICQNYFIEII